MTLDEFDREMNNYQLELDKENINFEEWQDKVSKFQKEYMDSVLDELEKKVDSKAMQAIYDVLEYGVNNSESGSSIVDVDNKEIADEVEDIIWEEIGDYLLDYEIYENSDETWSIDCMIAGNYVPYWDGWRE